MTNTRSFIGILGFLALATAGCGEEGDDAANSAIVVQQPPGSPVPVTYEAMCRHYCESLERTVVYNCLVSDTADTCAARFTAWADGCEELRCATRLVERPLCLAQCDSLAATRAAYCGQAQPGDERCAEPAATQDDACRAGCGP
jgi:hypothetical protein